MAHRAAYEGSPPKRPVDVINRTDIERASNAPRTSSAAIGGHDNGGHQVFWVDTVKHRIRKAMYVRFNVVTDIVYPEHDGVRRSLRVAKMGGVSQNA